MSTKIGPLRTLLRMRDVALALYEADKYGESLSKTQLQKFVYLVDSVTLLYALLPIRTGHQTYKHGPFDGAIQNAADCLAFRGFVKLASKKRGPQDELFLRYALTQAGKHWVNILLQSNSGQDRGRMVAAVASQVNVHGWPRLRQLVYAEPTYAFSRHRGYGQPLALLAPEENSAGYLVRLIARVIRQGRRDDVISPEIVVRVFFQYLDKYSSSINTSALAVEY